MPLPRLTPTVKLNVDGALDRAYIPSQTQPDVVYEMVRCVGGSWAHTDTRCRGWVERGDCYHIKALRGVDVANETDETRAITVAVNPLALVDELDLQKVMQSKLVPSERHIYSFRVKGQIIEGVSIDGVRDAARALSTQGEAIRELDVRLDHETERDAYFIATAGRFAISPDGKEILMDQCIRAKRQPKYARKADGAGEHFIDAWYEIGVAKAVRNATEALLPEALKDYIKDSWRGLARAAPPPPPQDADKPAAARVQTFLRNARESWDRDAWIAMGKDFLERFPDALTPRGDLKLGNQTKALAAEMWAYIRTKYEHGPGDEPREEQPG